VSYSGWCHEGEPVDTDKVKHPIRNFAQGEMVGSYLEERRGYHTLQTGADKLAVTQIGWKTLVKGHCTAILQGLWLIN